MPLRSGVIAPLWMRVPPTTNGGAELIVHLLVQALGAERHHGTLRASAAARTSAVLRPVCEVPVAVLMERGLAHRYEHQANAAMAMALEESGDFDVLHSHLGYEFLPFGQLS